MKQKNHFVSQFYLKNWADNEGKVWCYRTLVAHKNIPHFKRQSVSSVGFHRNLYIRLLAGDESDEMECMFDHDFVKLGIETVVGRGSWLYGIEHLLKNAVHYLFGHNWQVLHPADGYNWPVSDTPVIKLNYYGKNNYDFKGGWANKGSEIIMPISPQHLLYTQIGNSKSFRPNKLNVNMTNQFIRLIFESAHRMVFMSREEPTYLKYRPWIVSLQKLKEEQMEWRQFHEKQVEAEGRLNQ